MSTNAPVLKRRSSQVKGFWDPKQGPVYFIPRSIKVFDGSKKVDNTKPAYLIIGEMLGTAEGFAKGKTPVTLNKGDIVGVWGKPGMREIEQCKGVPTLIKEDGELDVGRGKPMKLFDVRSTDGGQLLTIDQDSRVFSSNAGLMFAVSPNCRVIRPKIDADPRSNSRSNYVSDANDDVDDDENDADEGMPIDEDGNPLF